MKIDKSDDELNGEITDLPEVDFSEYIDDVPESDDEEDELFIDLKNSLGHQVNEEMDDYTDEDFEYEEQDDEEVSGLEKPRKKHRILKGIMLTIGAVLLLCVVLVGTARGNSLIEKITNAPVIGDFVLWIAGGYVYDNTNNDNHIINQAATPPVINDTNIVTSIPADSGEEIIEVDQPRSEEYVTSYLIFGIEEIDGAANTDALMILSINTKDNTIKMTSLLRDTYVTIPATANKKENRNKINSVYAKGASGASTKEEARRNGAALLMKVIENTYDIKLSGYACANFQGFETVVDRLGGIDLELGTTERKYLNKENYISNYEYHTLVDGWNHMNGNQVLGYVRVRKVPTLGGANNDYGRTVRQRRVINAIINKYKSLGLFDMLPIMTDCLNEVSTNLTEDQITKALKDVLGNGITTTTSMRLPTEELFYDSGKKGIDGITYALVVDDYIEENIRKFHQFVFLDPEEATPRETK